MKPKILSLPSVDKKYRTDESNSADLVNCQFLPREPKKARESRPKNERNFARVLVCPHNHNVEKSHIVGRPKPWQQKWIKIPSRNVVGDHGPSFLDLGGSNGQDTTTGREHAC